jgi:DNA-binding beta-propeller fold protein YncE
MRLRHAPPAVISIVAALLPVRVSRAEDLSIRVLRCGEVATRELGAGETHRYVSGAGPNGGVVTVTDLVGTIGEIRGHAHGDVFGNDPLCDDQFTLGPAEVVDISSCQGATNGTYAIALSPFLSARMCGENRCDCAVALECGIPFDAELTVAGEVDSFALPPFAGQMSVTVIDPEDGGARFRIRRIGGQGADEEPCGNSLSLSVSASAAGSTGILVSACDGLKSGPYRVNAEVQPSCSMPPSPGATPTPSPNEVVQPLQDALYVSMDATGTIDVIPRGATAVVNTIRLAASSVQSLSLSSDGAFVYAPIAYESTIAAVDTASNRVVATAGTPAIYTTMALDPSGRFLYVPAFSYCGIGVIETATMQVVDVIPTNGFFGAADDINSFAARAVAVHGRFLYLAGDGRLGIFDIVSKNMVDLIEDDRIRLDASMRIHPSGELAYLFPVLHPLMAGSHFVVVVDLAAKAVRSEFPVGAIDLDFSADGTRVYIPTSGGVAVFDTATDVQIDSIDLGILSGGIAVSPTTGKLYVTNVDGDRDNVAGLAVVDPATHGFFRMFLAGTRPIDVVVLEPPTGLCVGDEDREAKVTIGELVTSVNFALDGCPGTQ